MIETKKNKTFVIDDVFATTSRQSDENVDFENQLQFIITIFNFSIDTITKIVDDSTINTDDDVDYEILLIVEKKKSKN